MYSLEKKSDRLLHGDTRDNVIDSILRPKGYIIMPREKKADDYAGVDRRIITPSGEWQLPDYKSTTNKFLIKQDVESKIVTPSNPFSQNIKTTHIYVYVPGWSDVKIYSVEQYYKNTFGSVEYATELINEFELWRNTKMTCNDFEELCREFIAEFKQTLPKWQNSYIDKKSDSIALVII